MTVKRPDLVERYTSLVSRAGVEFTPIKDNIIGASKSGVDSVYWSIQSALTAYQTAASKTASMAIADISNAALSLVSMLQQSHQQHAAFKESLDHLSVSWHGFTGSLTDYMLRMDQVILKQNEPKHKDTYTAVTPSVDSQKGRRRSPPHLSLGALM